MRESERVCVCVCVREREREEGVRASISKCEPNFLVLFSRQGLASTLHRITTPAKAAYHSSF